jgi:hypothetical protein
MDDDRAFIISPEVHAYNEAVREMLGSAELRSFVNDIYGAATNVVGGETSKKESSDEETSDEEDVSDEEEDVSDELDVSEEESNRDTGDDDFKSTIGSGKVHDDFEPIESDESTHGVVTDNDCEEIPHENNNRQRHD